MSSPASSLKKAKKSPLPGNRRVPFRHGLPSSHNGSASGSSFIPEDIRQSDHITRRHIVEGIRRHEATAPPTTGSSKAKVPSDSQLLGSMATRLAAVERELLAAKKEIIEKDQLISRLEERLVVLERSRSGSRPDSCVRELELKCLALQGQVDEMEEFLNDYGMVWVGSGANGLHEGTASKLSPEHREWSRGGGVETSGDTWVPRSSMASLESSLVHVGGCPFQGDFDRIIKNIKELNVLAGEGTAQVTKITSGAKLKPVEPIPLTLFKNGLVMFQGPFRPYTDHTTQQCVLDLMDGYFPSELQERFPDGVPFQVTDQRDVVFRACEYFPGSGHSLGGRRGPSRLPLTQGLQWHGREGVGSEKETSELPGPRLSMDTFLSRLPPSVIRGGRVIDIRSGIAGTLQGSENSAGVTLVETPVLQEIKSRLDLTENLRPPTPGHVTTLRIKSVTGQQTYILKMKYSDTIGDVRSHISKLQGTSSAPPDYQLKTSFPPQTFANPLATLSDCGLVPSANLFMAKSTS